MAYDTGSPYGSGKLAPLRGHRFRAVTHAPHERPVRSADPAVGGRVPDITVYDADGAPFELRSFEGDVTVLVFGCLT